MCFSKLIFIFLFKIYPTMSPTQSMKAGVPPQYNYQPQMVPYGQPMQGYPYAPAVNPQAYG